MNINKSENIFVLGVILAITGLLAALLMAYFAKITAGPIAEAVYASANRSLVAVMPPFKSKRSIDFNNIKFTGVFNEENKLTGIAGEFSVKGYGGDIKTLVGMNVDGSIRTVLILENNETPGLGSNVCVRKEQKTLKTLFAGEKKSDGLAPNRILDYYSGKSITSSAEWKVAKDGGDCPYITGATVSSRAVCKAVYHIVSVYSANRDAVKAELFKKEVR